MVETIWENPSKMKKDDQSAGKHNVQERIEKYGTVQLKGEKVKRLDDSLQIYPETSNTKQKRLKSEHNAHLTYKC